jgi:phage antirepressor YoqD-like protein
MEALTMTRKTVMADLVVVKQGGSDLNNTGTWFHEDVAMEFARWLAPKFGIWCNDRIKELLQTGHTSIELPTGLEYAKMLVASEEKLEKVEGQLALQAPAVKFYGEHVIKSDQLMPVSIIAKEYNTGARTFNKMLKAEGVIFNVGGVWVLKAEYDNLGYADHRIYETGLKTCRHLYWTEKGFEFIRSKIKA